MANPLLLPLLNREHTKSYKPIAGQVGTAELQMKRLAQGMEISLVKIAQVAETGCAYDCKLGSS